METPAERAAAGKSSSGTLRLSARQEQDLVVIKVSDDGRGIVTAEAVVEMSVPQILELVCHPGFSLSEKVTTVSGRGVGMNVVKQQLEALRGSLQVKTQAGQGSTFRLQLPAMLALVRALLVGVSGEQYALPSAYVERIIDVSELDPARIEHIGDRELLHLEDGLESRSLPLRCVVRLAWPG